MTAGASTAYYAALIAENKKRDRAEAENDIPEDEKVLMGDLSPDYRYML